MRFHLLAVPNTRTTAAYPLDGFCVRTMHFAKLLKRLGHEVILYGVAENEAPCDAFIACLSAEEQQGFLGDTPYQAAEFNPGTPLFLTFNTRASSHIRGIKRAGDVIATIAGSASNQVFDAHPELIHLEYSIGYRGICAPYRVYESSAWRHCVHGYTGVDGGRIFDAVIPPWFDHHVMPFVAEPEDYVAYCGRLVESKGIATVCRSAEAAGVRLVLVGHGNPALVTYGEYLGAVSMEERNRVLSRARAVLMPTQYLEPFGNVSAEAQLCGTPMLTTDFGAFAESVEHGVSGFRCVTVGEFAQAIDLARGLDRTAIRQRAIRLYSEDAAAVSYAQYFKRLALVRGAGFDSLEPTLDLEGVLCESC